MTTIRTKVEPIARDIEVIVNSLLSPQEQSKALAAYARERLVEAQGINRRVLGRLPPHTTTVDGRANAPLESVRPAGVIVFEFELVTEVLRWIAQTLIDRSPRVSGAYIAGHTLFADGQEIPLATQIPPAREYSFTNLVPYARRLEIGKTKSGRAFLVQVPNRIYERTAKDARSRFANIAKITFTYVGTVRGAFVRGRAGNRSAVRYPTIMVVPN